MTDRELLELAAKAAGLTKYSEWADQIKDHDSPHYMGCALHSKGVGGQADSWNPLIDDGDALRLAVMLGIEIKFNYGMVSDTVEARYPHGEHGGIKAVFESLDNDPYAATRRAIVRAASEIGRGME